MDLRRELLPACTVRVDVLKQPSGTGFFVGPGRVVTCAHVVQPNGPETEVLPRDLTVTDLQGIIYPVEKVLGLWPGEDADLTILQVPSGTSHPSVLLDAQLNVGVDLFTYGFPINPDTGAPLYEGGVPATYKSEGEMARLGWVKFKDGQVQPGMSGSPVYDENTGAVCAIVKRTRDSLQALGGYGVPVATLIAKAPELVHVNEEAHALDSRWLDRLPPEQLQAWRVARGPKVATSPARHFVITVEEHEDLGWRVGAQVHPDGAPVPAKPVNLNTVRVAVARLVRAWTARGRITEAEQVRTLGEILYRAMFPGEIEEALKRVLSGPDERVQISLRFEDEVEADLVNLPWEHLYRPDQGQEGEMSVAADQRIGFVRTLAHRPSQTVAEPLREEFSVLLVTVDTDEEDASADMDVRAVTEHLVGLKSSLRNVRIDTLETPQPKAVLERLREDPCDVVHYIGFGSFDGIDNVALGGVRRRDFVPGSTFRKCVNVRGVRLVVAQPVLANAVPVPADFAMLGLPLVRELPAAVTFQFPLPSDLYKEFNGAFYSALSAGKPIDMAVQLARENLSVRQLDANQHRAFVSPALFQREPAELRLVRGGPPPSRRPTTSRPPLP